MLNEKLLTESVVPPKKLRVLEVFAGAGGLSLGFDLVRSQEGERAFEIVLAVDNFKHACETLRRYFRKEYGADSAVLEADLTKPDTHQRILDACKEGIDLIIGGPPCQSFSLIGPRSGYGVGDEKYEKYRTMDKLYREYLALVRELKPSFIIFENVKGILSKKDEQGIRYIDVIVSDFRKLGYSFESENEEIKTDYLLLNVADYGVPQIRQRVFLIGNNLGIKNPFPKPTHKPEKHVSLAEAIGDLPKLKAKVTTKKMPLHKKVIVEKYNKKIYSGKERVEYHHDLFEEHYRRQDREGKTFLKFIKPNGIQILNHHIARKQQKSDIGLFKGMKQGMTANDVVHSKKKNIRKLRKLIKYDMKSFTDKYKKQNWSKPCSTIFAHLEKDGNRFIHPDSGQARTLTVREAARIQSFPDYYPSEEGFAGPYNKIFKQIGNAVPPLLAYHIGLKIYEVLRKV